MFAQLTKMAQITQVAWLGPAGSLRDTTGYVGKLLRLSVGDLLERRFPADARALSGVGREW